MTYAKHWQDNVRKNREAFFHRLYQAAYTGVARWVAGQGGTKEETEDVFHDALILVFEKSLEGQLDHVLDPKAYVGGVCKRLWWERRRQDSRYVALVPGRELQAEAKIPSASLQSKVWSYLESSGSRCLEILQAFYYFRWPMEEIAAQLGYRNARSATVQKYKCLEKVKSIAKKERHAEISA